jgi:hypothetical protein
MDKLRRAYLQRDDVAFERELHNIMMGSLATLDACKWAKKRAEEDGFFSLLPVLEAAIEKSERISREE